MGTSKSGSESAGWEGGASLFSGRPDPTWSVSPQAARRLEEIWRRLEPSSDAPPAAPPLGYRGSLVRDTQGRAWYAYGGRVVLKSGSVSETRTDPDRQFEKTLLASAPAGILPESFLTSIRGE
jgi:hypothetical protein